MPSPHNGKLHSFFVLYGAVHHHSESITLTTSSTFANMTKRTKSESRSCDHRLGQKKIALTTHRGRRDREIWHEVGRLLFPASMSREILLCNSRIPLERSGADPVLSQIWRLPPKASQENGNHSARTLRLHLLREKYGQAALSGNLEMQRVWKDGGWWCVDSIVSREQAVTILDIVVPQHYSGQQPRAQTNRSST